MSHGKLRQDDVCLNCGHEVPERFCSHCGQENTETRQPFYYLFTHFFEDFTHYDGQFWKTIRYLLFSPGKLTCEYLAGKRLQYVAPVKLYIFLSFIVFFVPTLFPGTESKRDAVNISFDKEDKISVLAHDSLSLDEARGQALDSAIRVDSHDIGSKAKFDSLAEVSDQKVYGWVRPVVDKFYDLKEKGNSNREILEKVRESFIHILPKALFTYLPIFAFLLWLFHKKKKWWFFDHGIFTLHFFSFLLLSVFIITVANEIDSLVDVHPLSVVIDLFVVVTFIYMMTYFFKAHRVVYQSSKSGAALKGTILFFINMVLISLLLVVFLLFSFMTLH